MTSDANVENAQRIPAENDPTVNKVLYHYCSTDSFLSIIANKNIRLSDCNTMNDYSEMHWAYDRFVEAVNKEYDRLDPIFIDALDKIVSESQLRMLQLVGAFSTDGDVLSQWRAYADDGRGVSIGFDADKIGRLSVRSVVVEYDHSAQINHYRALLRAAYDVYRDLNEKERRNFLFQTGANVGVDLACFKNPAFAEEKEVRIIRAAVVSFDKHGIYLADEGGTGEDKPSRRKLPIKYRSRGGGVIAYVELPLHGLGGELIKRVVIGPRSVNNGNEIKMALRSNQFTGAEVVKSRATYR